MQKSLYLIAVLSVLASGCDLFTTRTPEPPATGNTFIWSPATSISALLQDFQGALQVVDAANYAKAFVASTDVIPSGGSSTYTFIPRSGLSSSFANWNVLSEQSYITKLASQLSQNPQITVQFTGENIVQSNASSGTVSMQYQLLIPVTQSKGIPTNVTGTLQFSVELVTTPEQTQEWRIYAWTDTADPAQPTSSWSDLKYSLS